MEKPESRDRRQSSTIVFLLVCLLAGMAGSFVALVIGITLNVSALLSLAVGFFGTVLVLVYRRRAQPRERSSQHATPSISEKPRYPSASSPGATPNIECLSCHKTIPEDANLCPYCATVQKPPHVAQPAAKPTHSPQGSTRPTRKVALFALLAVGAYWVASTLHESQVADFAKGFAEEQLGKKGINDWSASHVIVPSFALLLPSYDVNVVMERGSDEKIITAHINGQCLLNSCSISIRGIELLSFKKENTTNSW